MHIATRLFLLCLTWLCLTLSPAAAIGKNCDESNIIYESDPDNRGDNNTPFAPTTLRFDGPDILVTAGGKTTRYLAAGSAGSGIPIFIVAPEGGEPVTYRIITLTRITAPDEPDHLLIFNNDLYWPLCTRAPSEPTPVPAEKARKVIFSDEFEGSELSKDWDVGNPNGDYSVEKGTLLTVSATPGGLANPDIPNTFKLVGDLPNSDYTVTVKLNVAFATGKEIFAAGLFDDKDNYLTASLLARSDCCYPQAVDLKIIKVSGGQPAEFVKPVFEFAGQTSGMPFDKGANAVAQPIILKLIKEGHNFSASANFAGQKDDAGNPVWVTTDAVTALRPPKTLVMNPSQSNEVPGETTFTIDSITIDVPADSAQ